MAFSKKTSKRSSAPAPSGPARAASKVRAAAPLPVTNPYVGAAGATLLLIGSVMALIAVMGDPKAGTPSVRLALGLKAPPGWNEARPQNGSGSLGADTFELTESAA